MSDKEHTYCPTRYQIGEEVSFVILDEEGRETYKVPAYVRAIIFSNVKVRYSLYLKNMKTTIHNVDSVFVVDTENSPTHIEFEVDNYS